MEAGPRGERGGLLDSTRVNIEKSRFDAVIFDLDGVVTQTAAVHAAAWKRLFDAYLAERAARTGTGPGGASDAAGGAPDGALRPFDLEADYRLYVDGKPRYDGVRPGGRQSADSATARTTSSTPRCASTACGRSRQQSRSSTSCATRECGSA
jgi:hypothetical protein